MLPPELEICAETPQACAAAAEGGAHRIEICTALDQGGLTPSHALIQAALYSAGGLPVHVLLRPRGGDFVYSDAEFRIVCGDLEHALALGASGFVFGALTPEGTVDVPRLQDVLRLAGPKQVTFHRAFDQTQNLFEALTIVIDSGFGRVLTSGGRPTVREGMQTIAALANQAAGRLRIAAGGGLTTDVATCLRRLANVDLHASLRKKASAQGAQTDPLWDTRGTDWNISAADVRALADTLRVVPSP